MKHTSLILTALLLSLPLVPNDITCPFTEEWTQVTGNATATVYHACKTQCNRDFLHTASNYEIIPSKIAQQRILAMERTMMAKYGIKYGDVVLLEGTGGYDGLWQVQDTMNKRFAGQEKIDLLIPKNAKGGKWENVRVSVPANPFTKISRTI